MPSIRNFAAVSDQGSLLNSAELDATIYKFGTAAVRFYGDRHSYVKSAESFTLGTQSWCFEAWVNLSASQPNSVVRIAQISPDLPSQFGPGHVSLRANGGLSVFAYDYSPSAALIETAEVVIGVGWKHVALSREGSAWRLFVNGALVGSATWAGAVNGTNPWLIGGSAYSQTGMSGWADDVRFTLGAPRYTSGFTVPTAEFSAFPPNSGAYRYYRISSITLPAGSAYIEISEIRVYSATGTQIAIQSVTASAASALPIVNLTDGNPFTRAYWTANEVATVGFNFILDLGASATVAGLAMGGFDNSTRYPTGLTFERSNDGVTWQSATQLSSLTYPGNNTVSSVYDVAEPVNTDPPNSARYFKINITANNGSIYVGVGEMSLRYNNVDLVTTGKAYSSSSNINASYGPQYAFDGLNNTSYWATNITTDPSPYLLIDMGAAVSVDEIQLTLSTQSGINESPNSFTLQYSRNGVTWITAAELTGQTQAFWSLGVARSFPIAISSNDAGDVLFTSVKLLYKADVYVKPQYKITDTDGYFYAPLTPIWPVNSTNRSSDALPVLRYNYGGNGKISGTVKIKGTPDLAVARRVRLIRDLDGKCVAEMWSDSATGAYEFLGFDPLERYTVLAYDYEQNFRAVVADNLTPEPYL